MLQKPKKRMQFCFAPTKKNTHKQGHFSGTADHTECHHLLLRLFLFLSPISPSAFFSLCLRGSPPHLFQPVSELGLVVCVTLLPSLDAWSQLLEQTLFPTLPSPDTNKTQPPSPFLPFSPLLPPPPPQLVSLTRVVMVSNIDGSRGLPEGLDSHPSFERCYLPAVLRRLGDDAPPSRLLTPCCFVCWAPSSSPCPAVSKACGCGLASTKNLRGRGGWGVGAILSPARESSKHRPGTTRTAGTTTTQRCSRAPHGAPIPLPRFMLSSGMNEKKKKTRTKKERH